MNVRAPAPHDGTAPGRTRATAARPRPARPPPPRPRPYLDYGCGRGDLLALLATRGSATGFVVDPTLAELARSAAPGCPVHTNAEALPAGVFRGVLAVTTTPPDPTTLATWRRVLGAGRPGACWSAPSRGRRSGSPSAGSDRNVGAGLPQPCWRRMIEA